MVVCSGEGGVQVAPTPKLVQRAVEDCKWQARPSQASARLAEPGRADSAVTIGGGQFGIELGLTERVGHKPQNTVLKN